MGLINGVVATACFENVLIATNDLKQLLITTPCYFCLGQAGWALIDVEIMADTTHPWLSPVFLREAEARACLNAMPDMKLYLLKDVARQQGSWFWSHDPVRRVTCVMLDVWDYRAGVDRVCIQ